ncbi:MAG: hypothetical protein J6X02_05905 [Bacilli bacterium]|nr:hypothetical protein [Bacilli bacterium]
MSLFRSFNTKNAYTVEELYNILRNYQFSAGVPTLEQEGVNNIIAFPPIDNFNQLRIMPSGGRVGNQFTKWIIFKMDHKVGLGNWLKNEVLDDITGGFTSFFSVVGSSASEGYRFVDKLISEIDALNL